MPLIDTEKAWRTAQRIYSDPVLLHAIKNVLSSTEITEAYTGGQISEIIRQAEEERAENGTLRTGLEFLKNCINCKIRNTCPRHCGKVVHSCNHWEYGDPVVRGRWIEDHARCCRRCSVCGFEVHDDAAHIMFGDWHIAPKHCNCGARMDGDGNA
jgi:hypothetical protein